MPAIPRSAGKQTKLGDVGAGKSKDVKASKKVGKRKAGATTSLPSKKRSSVYLIQRSFGQPGLG